MLATFESILPIFLLVAAGNVLRRLPVIDRAAWPGLEQLAYWFLYPVLLFNTIYKADFSGLRLDSMLLALLVTVGMMGVLMLALARPLERLGLTSRTEYSSVFQTSLRWNGFMALAIAEKLFEPEGAAVVALAMAAIIIPVNVLSVAVVIRFADRSADWPRILRSIAANPLIVGTVAAILLRFAPFGLYGPLDEALGLTGRAALGMGLVAIGAGLRPGDMMTARPALWLPVAMKLVVFPVLLIGLALAFGVSGREISYLALCAAVPTAMNGYLLARRLGGDAELYAAVATLQTAISFATIPAALTIADYIASG